MSQFDWTPHYGQVDLILNGQYRGIYQLGEKVKVGKKRVNVGDDGFLLEIDGKASSEEITFDVTHLSYPVNIKEPTVVVDDDDFNYVKDYLIAADAALFSDDFLDEEEGYRKYLDMDSFVEWYVIVELSKNVDACRFFTSCYMNLKRGGKLKMGPLWDFDLAFGKGNDYDFQWSKDPEGFELNTRVSWFNRLFQDPAFVTKVKNRFNEYYNNRQQIYDHIDSQASIVKSKIVEDNKLWGTISNTTDTDEQVQTAYQQNVDYLKTWIEQRFTWLHTNLNSLGD